MNKKPLANDNSLLREAKKKNPSVSKEYFEFKNFVVSRFRRDYGQEEGELDNLIQFLALDNQRKVTESRRIIKDAILDRKVPGVCFSLAIAQSETLLPGYSTLDEKHRFEIEELMHQINSYLQDKTRKRPLNALMLAAPGAGKSHFIKQLAVAMKDQQVQAVMYNMATMKSTDDMAQPVDDLRNLKVNDQFPLLFLDEFDSDPARYPALLPLLWDGELQIGHRDLKLGKSVIVLAGSNPDLPKMMDLAAKMRTDVDGFDKPITSSKVVDLLSRINGGVINIPDLDLRTNDRDRRIDKVCIAISLIKNRFGNDIFEIPRPLLTFIAETRFRYGVRSIAHLVDMIDKDALIEGKLVVEKLNLPFENEDVLQKSNLSLHLLDKDQVFGIVNRWRECSSDAEIIKLVDIKSAKWNNILNMIQFLSSQGTNPQKLI